MAKLLIPAVAGAVSLSTVAAVALLAIYDTDEVKLTVDGSSSTIEVRENSVGDVLEAQGITLGDHDVVLPAADTAISEGLEISVSYGRPLELTVDGETRTVWTTARTVGDALDQLSLTQPDSKLSASRSDGITREGLDLKVATAKDVKVTVKGQPLDLRTAGTVSDALAARGVKPDADDKVSPSAHTPLTDGLAITYVNVEVKNATKQREVDFQKKEVKSDKMAKGETKVTTKGVKGSATDTVQEVYHDGKLVSSKVTGSKVHKQPVTEVTTVGTKAAAPSPATDSSSGSGTGPSNLTPATGNTCKASYYWQGQKTANGEQFNTNDFTAAHKSLPFNTRVKVTNPSNGKSTVVRINDRGPYIAGRCLDLSTAAMKAIGGTASGVITVNWEVV